MWAKLRTCSTKEDMQKSIKAPFKNLTVNEEYLCAVRTKSFADFFIKVQFLVNDPLSSSSSPAFFPPALSEFLLNPGQETTSAALQSSPFNLSKESTNLKSLLSNYFDVSAEASTFCSRLLKSMSRIQADYASIHQLITTNGHDFPTSPNDLRSSLILSSPFSDLTNGRDFASIHDKHAAILHQLKSNRKRVARKIKLIRSFNRASGVCVTAAAAVFVAAHTLTALLMGPALFSVPLKKKIRNLRFVKYGFLKRVCEQIDVAAKGAYILKRDFDTMGRLVARVEDEIERSKALIGLCLERGSVEVLREMKKGEFGFRKQVEELEEHVCLCLVGINRARAMVVKEISRENCV